MHAHTHTRQHTPINKHITFWPMFLVYKYAMSLHSLHEKLRPQQSLIFVHFSIRPICQNLITLDITPTQAWTSRPCHWLMQLLHWSPESLVHLLFTSVFESTPHFIMYRDAILETCLEKVPLGLLVPLILHISDDRFLYVAWETINRRVLQPW